MAEQIKRGLTIHSPTINAGPVIDVVVDDIMQSIEHECSMTVYESDEAATADLRKNLKEQIQTETDFEKLVTTIVQTICNEWVSVDVRLAQIIEIANTHRAWLAIQAQGVESFDAKVGRSEE